MKFIKESNRGKHFWAGFFIGLIFTVIGATIAGIYKELKDRKDPYGGKFDWLDLLSTVLGGLLGSINLVVAAIVQYKDGEWINTLIWYFMPITFLVLFYSAFTHGVSIKGIWKTIKTMFGIQNE